MEANLGVDAGSGLVHSLTTTAANVVDIVGTAALLHGDDDNVFADAGYTGVAKRGEMNPVALDWQIAAKRSTVRKVNKKGHCAPASMNSNMPRRAFGRRSSIRLMCSRTYFLIAILVITDCPRILLTCSCCLA